MWGYRKPYTVQRIAHDNTSRHFAESSSHADNSIMFALTEEANGEVADDREHDMMTVAMIRNACLPNGSAVTRPPGSSLRRPYFGGLVSQPFSLSHSSSRSR